MFIFSVGIFATTALLHVIGMFIVCLFLKSPYGWAEFGAAVGCGIGCAVGFVLSQTFSNLLLTY